MAHQLFITFPEGSDRAVIDMVCQDNDCWVVHHAKFSDVYQVETLDVINFYTLGLSVARRFYMK